MGPSGRFTHVMIYWIVWDRFMQVLYLGRAPRTKETLPDFREKCRVTRHSRVFHGLTGSQRTPGIWGVTSMVGIALTIEREIEDTRSTQDAGVGSKREDQPSSSSEKRQKTYASH